MRPLLVASAASGLGGTTGDITWNMTIPAMGANGLIVIAGVGAETGGEQNPEEINVCYMSGVSGYFTPVLTAGQNETNMGLFYIKGSQIPPAGTYTCGINYKDSPKQAERKRGVSAAFTNVRNQAHEAQNSASGSGGPRSLSLTPLTNNALVLAAWGWRVGFAETWGWGTPIVTSRGDNSSGITLAYSIVAPPAAQSISCNATNPEDNGLVAAAFAPAKDRGAILFNVL